MAPKVSSVTSTLNSIVNNLTERIVGALESFEANYGALIGEVKKREAKVKEHANMSGIQVQRGSFVSNFPEQIRCCERTKALRTDIRRSVRAGFLAAKAEAHMWSWRQSGRTRCSGPLNTRSRHFVSE